MERLKNTGNHLDLNNFEVVERFDVYELGDYDFDENLDFGSKKGVYIFTRRDMTSELSSSFQREIYHHIPLYCGKTENFNKRFNDHFKSDNLRESNCDYISIYICDDENPADLEKKILSLIKFKYNKEYNENPKYKEDVKLNEV